MQRADPRAVEGALHFHRAILSLQRFGTQPALLFLPGQQLFAGFKRRFNMCRHHFLQAFHQVANVFHAHPRKPRGIWLSGSLTLFTSRFGCPPLLARLICTLRASFCCHCTW
ncbi:Uncharacterised protein [Klebsiella pneumoniae subsp. rhinoscleromatis]|nr:Uncharacterised protein [Klebsiella pneumoniae subsp. rhinoscleromatis]